MKIHLNIGTENEQAKCGSVTRHAWSFLATTNDSTKVTCRDCAGTRRVSSYPRDTRSAEIKTILKKIYPTATHKVRIDKYSMGESINVYTSILNNMEWEEKRTKALEIESLLAKYQRVDRDQWGEILSGGNTFMFINSI